jgi:hypothetical protein
MGFVQKCGWGATVSPLHSTTRVRISVIFTVASLFAASRAIIAKTLFFPFHHQD